MDIKIRNSEEDQYGNSKENIFLAFDLEGNYLGSAYAYASINYHQTYETPYIIFIGVNIESNIDKLFGEEVTQKLFNKVFLRAKELRIQRPDLKSRIYAGFEYDKDKLDFYIKNGFEEDYSIVMEANIPKNFTYILPENVKVTELKINCDTEVMAYKAMHDEIFVTPLDIDTFAEQGRAKYFKNLSFLIGGKVQGGCTIFEKDGFGYVETIYVLPEVRGSGISKTILNYIFDYFLSKALDKTKLEVWESNERAVKLYKSFGYNEVKKNLMFPRIIL
ncbi:GNAT family N-acetyltransferase [Clostridium tagluense]|uniref:GNAT family N-acetyltransferase n=1 Tax=Clostridium tagluense TaxID=360422 RepID=UPI001C6F258A|nr:GNAT family N-acetyltransferase [Clostridium tagluense]MBW9156176.1 GNAT family N-acetyltransferase [Clostridium tagluense]WLC65585.1 GNAT family N-acetyltransferase [Clostridium tagluense]